MDAVNPSPNDKSWPRKFNWNRYGVRVPGIVITPWLKKGIDEKVYDHSTVPKTIKEIFDLKSDYLSERVYKTIHNIKILLKIVYLSHFIYIG